MSGKSTKTIEDISKWIEENYPKFRILEWGGKGRAKSKFIDTERNVEFTVPFDNFQAELKKNSTYIFGATKEERMAKTKATNLSRHGTEYAVKLPKAIENRNKVNIEKYGVARWELDCSNK